MKTDPEKTRIMTTFFRGIERCMTEKGLRRSQLKLLSGVNLERYKVSQDMREPSLSSAVKLADALEVSIDDLCGRTAYVRDTEHWSAGECAEALLSVVKQLGGEISHDGQSIRLPESNVTSLIKDSYEYSDYYDGAKKFDPSRFPDSAEDARAKWTEERIKELKKTRNEVEIIAEREDVPLNQPSEGFNDGDLPF